MFCNVIICKEMSAKNLSFLWTASITMANKTISKGRLNIRSTKLEHKSAIIFLQTNISL